MALDANPEDPEGCARSIQIKLPADAHIFETVAKFRAIRQLWHAFWACCGVAVEPTITAVTSPRMMADVDEYTNILRCTHAATGAILGGCDALCISAFDHRWPEAPRNPAACRSSPMPSLKKSLAGVHSRPHVWFLLCGAAHGCHRRDGVDRIRAWSCTDGQNFWIGTL